MLAVLVWLPSCVSTNVDQACRPEIQSGCPDGEFCSIRSNGASICIPSSLGRLSEGALCDGFDTVEVAQSRINGVCAPGLGCFLDGFTNRCLRFCEANASDVRTACQNKVAEAFAHPFGEQSECTLRIYDRSEIGACRLACEFGGSGNSAGCPEGTTCGLTPDAYEARCLPEGSGVEGHDCNLSCPCATGLTCVPEVRTSRCRRAVGGSGCGDSAFRSQVMGTRNPLSSSGDDWVPYEYCPQCIELSVRLSEVTVSICAGQSCDASDQLIDMNGIDQTTITDSLQALIGSDYSVIVGLERRDSAWYWPSGDTPVAVDGDSGANGCVALQSDGSFRVAEDCSGLRLCQMATISVCESN